MPEFAWPWMFAVLPLPLLARWLPRAAETTPALRLHAAPSPSAAGSGESMRSAWIRFLLLSMCWIALVTAAAQPQYVGPPVSEPVSGRDLMLAVDISGSMEQKDLTLDDASATRLSVVQAVIADFVLRRTGDRLGLILFGTQAYLQSPLTFDHATLDVLLNEAEIGIAGGKTAIGSAIGLATRHLKDRPAENRVLILLTDGASNAGEVDPLQAADLASQVGIRIYTIGVGAESMERPGLFGGLFGSTRVNPSADLDEETLLAIAETTGGRYFRARNQQELSGIYQLLDELEPVPAPDEVFRPVTPLFYWPLGLALLASFLLALPALLPRAPPRAADAAVRS